MSVPEAEVVRARRFSPILLVPLAALLLAGWLARSAWSATGPEVVVRFDQGHGIKAGDTLRHRGITVGEVRAVRLAQDLQSVALTIRLDRAAAGLARSGTRFWIVRPTVSLEGVAGLETIVGARYVAALPGPTGGEEQHEFIGLETPPLLQSGETGGLEVVLSAPRRFGLLRGAPIYYRQMQVGSVVGITLSSDATSVEVSAYIEPAFAPLVRTNTRFWQVSGIDMKLALTEGLSLRMESLRTLISGGIALATPNDPGPPVTTGHVFLLRDRYEDDWLEWRPAIPIGSSLLPEGAIMPEPLRAVLRWRRGRFLAIDQERVGNLLQLARGVVGPADLLTLPDEAIEGEPVRLEVAGKEYGLEAEVLWSSPELKVLDLTIPGAAVWPEERVRVPDGPEDCLVVADGLAPQALSAARLSPSERGWEVEKRLTFEPRWHGAIVLSREDGMLVGVLLVTDGRAVVAPVPGP